MPADLILNRFLLTTQNEIVEPYWREICVPTLLTDEAALDAKPLYLEESIQLIFPQKSTTDMTKDEECLYYAILLFLF